MADYITVLTVRQPTTAIVTKRLFRQPDGTIGKLSFGKAKGTRPFLFDAEVIVIDDLNDLATALRDLRHQPNKLIIRGLPVGESRNVRRQLLRSGESKGVFDMDPAGHFWLMIDFDAVPVPPAIDPDNAEACLRYLTGLLPDPFRHADFVWQWSSGHGFDRHTLRVHLFFWSQERRTDAEFKRWAGWINGHANQDTVNPKNHKLIDPSLFNPVQVHYTADPLLDDDVDDPVAVRMGVHRGEAPTVVLDVPAITWDEHQRALKQASRPSKASQTASSGQPLLASDRQARHGSGTIADRCLDHLARIGDDHEGFHQPIRGAIWFWTLAYPPGEDAVIKAVLRQLINGAVCLDTTRDLDHYLSDDYLDSSLRGARHRQRIASRQEIDPSDWLDRRSDWNRRRNQMPVSEEYQIAALAALEDLFGQAK
jgi:hypothetical protein